MVLCVFAYRDTQKPVELQEEEEGVFGAKHTMRALRRVTGQRGEAAGPFPAPAHLSRTGDPRSLERTGKSGCRRREPAVGCGTEGSVGHRAQWATARVSPQTESVAIEGP